METIINWGINLIVILALVYVIGFMLNFDSFVEVLKYIYIAICLLLIIMIIIVWFIIKSDD
jgi:hypothetical protein